MNLNLQMESTPTYGTGTWGAAVGTWGGHGRLSSDTFLIIITFFLERANVHLYQGSLFTDWTLEGFRMLSSRNVVNSNVPILTSGYHIFMREIHFHIVQCGFPGSVVDSIELYLAVWTLEIKYKNHFSIFVKMNLVGRSTDQWIAVAYIYQKNEHPDR